MAQVHLLVMAIRPHSEAIAHRKRASTAQSVMSATGLSAGAADMHFGQARELIFFHGMLG